ncbi:hypothetical protein M438DRAFT_341432 [Aureobasidium pullulans EXF-150]|uniref:Uncharacterized protein n=1 Tax=Aureobasidium pullulans EXF-150 TaxID=1043002 RepID=A0A074XVU2_AURPU|nr:uncharacterized protein M438DRAFT_341432 [Aureobasidium pullulans EXF-150]KEQ89703.1 hypothetical protein M438DRAFT_341432 [Aureobasidium pullulans EXF-150]
MQQLRRGRRYRQLRRYEKPKGRAATHCTNRELPLIRGSYESPLTLVAATSLTPPVTLRNDLRRTAAGQSALATCHQEFLFPSSLFGSVDDSWIQGLSSDAVY